jgi:hypothetical protein
MINNARFGSGYAGSRGDRIIQSVEIYIVCGRNINQGHPADGGLTEEWVHEAT